ncbi:MAG: domain S-box protein [Mucilaginibacter sp.]|nr:domain S-box protein [Mucilaginibacter sp.]
MILYILFRMNYSSEKMFESFFNQTATPICVIKADSPRFTIIAINEQYKKTTKTSFENIIGKGVFEVYKPYDEASAKQFELLTNALAECIETKQQVKLPVLSFEGFNANLKAFEKSYWQIEINPVCDLMHNVDYMMCDTRNITDQEINRILIKEANDREQQLHEELKAINEELAATNEELLATNETLIDTVEQLNLSQKTLQDLNIELEERVIIRTKELSESEEKFKSILNSIPQIAWTNTIGGDVDFYNQRWYDYTGLDFEQTKAWGWKEVIHPDDIQFNLDKLSAIMNSDSAGEFEIREKRFDGIYRWHLIRIEPLKDKEGKVVLWIGTATDIQDIKDMQQQKDDFISIASHELKTPLTTLKATLQLMDQLKEKTSHVMLPQLIEQANKSMDKTSRLVEDLLNASRLNQGQLKLNKSVFTLSETLSRCSLYVESTNKYELILQGDTELHVIADEYQIDQVIINLINNAIKYAPLSLKIYLIIQKDLNMAKISVKDNGPGIAPDLVPLLFNRYSRANPSGYQYSGMGLGLYIGAEIIKNHGGQIGVDSELGNGSTFWFTLPLHTDQA